MESVSLIDSSIVDPLSGCTLDLEDAYFHIPVNWFCQMFLAFVIDGLFYVFQYLPFGLSMALWAFNHVMKPIKSHLHQLAFIVYSFLYDFLFLHSHRDGLENLTKYILFLFRTLGFRINLRKSLLNFASSLVPLGRLQLCPLISWMNSHSVPSSWDDSSIQIPPEGLDRFCLPEHPCSYDHAHSCHPVYDRCLFWDGVVFSFHTPSPVPGLWIIPPGPSTGWSSWLFFFIFPTFFPS